MADKWLPGRRRHSYSSFRMAGSSEHVPPLKAPESGYFVPGNGEFAFDENNSGQLSGCLVMTAVH